jgi:hypothetical protein
LEALRKAVVVGVAVDVVVAAALLAVVAATGVVEEAATAGQENQGPE